MVVDLSNILMLTFLIAFALISGTCDTIDRANNYDARIVHIEKAIERAENGSERIYGQHGSL